MRLPSSHKTKSILTFPTFYRKTDSKSTLQNARKWTRLRNMAVSLWYTINVTFSGASSKLRKAFISFVTVHLPLFIRPHRKTRLPLDGLSWKLIYESSLSLHRALRRVTWSAHQPMHKLKLFTLQLLKMLRHVSIIRSSSGNCPFLAKITLLKTFTAWFSYNSLVMWQHVVLRRSSVVRSAPDCVSDSRVRLR